MSNYGSIALGKFYHIPQYVLIAFGKWHSFDKPIKMAIFMQLTANSIKPQAMIFFSMVIIYTLFPRTILKALSLPLFCSGTAWRIFPKLGIALDTKITFENQKHTIVSKFFGKPVKLCLMS